MNDAEIALLLDVVRAPEKPRTSLEARLTHLEDVRSIQDLVLAYGWLCDARRWDELLDLYTDDFERFLVGTLEEHLVGKEALRERYEAPVLPRKGGAGGPPPASQVNAYEIRHMIHPPVVRVSDDGNEATAAAVYSIVATSGDGAELRRGEHEGGYIFGFRKVPDVGWRFCRMVVISENARNPLFQGG
jgi:ketosteroid isomerase-like protein